MYGAMPDYGCQNNILHGDEGHLVFQIFLEKCKMALSHPYLHANPKYPSIHNYYTEVAPAYINV